MKSARPLLLSEPAVLGALVVALALVLGTILFSSISTRAIVGANDRAVHAQQSLLAINQLLGTVTEAETSQRGYLLTRNDDYLEPYHAAASRYPAEFAALSQQVASHPELGATVGELSRLIDEKFREIATTISLRKKFGIAPALNVVETDQGERTMAAIRSDLQRLERHELDEMAAHAATATTRAQNFQRLSFGLIGVTIILSCVGGWFLLRRVRELEKLVTVCAWTGRVKWQDRWISFEEYLGKRFNFHFTHGISDDAARQMEHQIGMLPPVEEFETEELRRP
jgi:CHASE3 domain sensor protein